MMKTSKTVSIADERGELYEFTDIEDRYRQVNVLISKRGTVRGRHYHKMLIEKFFIIAGLVEVTVKDLTSGKSSTFRAGPFDQFSVEPLHEHTLEFLQDTTILSFYSTVFDEENPDIFVVS